MGALKSSFNEFTEGISLEWAFAAAALVGGDESGDRHLVAVDGARALVAVVDGLGHGKEAALAADIAVDTLSRHPHEPVISLIRNCHERLKGTRGVAMSVASISPSTHAMEWVGVGNVEGLLLRARREVVPARESLVLRAGVVGFRLPTLRSSVVGLEVGDTLIFATDGIRSGFFQEIAPHYPPQEIVDHILDRFAQPSDDSLVLVVRLADGAA
jgi:negative regulator of sigma-B (phosphoserine phosphatase)